MFLVLSGDADCICDGGVARTCPMEPRKRNLAFDRPSTCLDPFDTFGVTFWLRKVGAHICIEDERGRRPRERFLAHLRAVALRGVGELRGVARQQQEFLKAVKLL